MSLSLSLGHSLFSVTVAELSTTTSPSEWKRLTKKRDTEFHGSTQVESMRAHWKLGPPRHHNPQGTTLSTWRRPLDTQKHKSNEPAYKCAEPHGDCCFLERDTNQTQSNAKDAAVVRDQLFTILSLDTARHFDHGLPSEVLEQSFGVRQEQQGFSSLNLFRQSEAQLPFGRDHRPCARGPPCTGDRPLPSQALAVHLPTLLRRS